MTDKLTPREPESRDAAERSVSAVLLPDGKWHTVARGTYAEGHSGATFVLTSPSDFGSDRLHGDRITAPLPSILARRHRRR